METVGKGKKYHRCVDPCVPYPIDELKFKTRPFLRYEQSDMWSFVGDAHEVRAIDRSIADRDDFVLIFESRPVE